MIKSFDLLAIASVSGWGELPVCVIERGDLSKEQARDILQQCADALTAEIVIGQQNEAVAAQKTTEVEDEDGDGDGPPPE